MHKSSTSEDTHVARIVWMQLMMRSFYMPGITTLDRRKDAAPDPVNNCARQIELLMRGYR